MPVAFELNEQQLNASCFGQPRKGGGVDSGPLLIIAGAGTGKTSTLAHRTAHLILNKVPPERMLLMTFSRRAAREMVRRAQRIVTERLRQGKTEPPAVQLPWTGTFHSVANRLLRAHAGAIGLDPGFTIMDRDDAADMIDVLRQELGYSSGHKRFPGKGTCVSIYSRCVNAQCPLEEVLKNDFPWCRDWHAELKQLFKRYAEAKLDQASLDYDDLLLYWFLMVEDESLARSIGDMFDHVLIDEYQDTNLLQAGILQRLFPEGRGLTVVGDDAQSIYSFRSAEIDNILSFASNYSPAATVIKLERNYRSTQAILDAANALLSESSGGYEKMLYSDKTTGAKPKLVTVEDDAAQSQYIISKVLAEREGGTALRHQAVLFRSGHHSDHLEVDLIRHDIPFVKYGGLRFLEAAHVKDVLSILRWADNPKHRISGFRVLKLLAGVGPGIATNALDYLQARQFDIRTLDSFAAPRVCAEEWAALVEVLLSVHFNAVPWNGQVDLVKEWYRHILERNYDDSFVRFGDIEQLTQISQQFPTRERFLTELTLDPPISSGDLSGPPHKDDDFLILSTIHSAKGQEWKNVFILNVADGNFPNEYATGNPKAMEEERRLFYVGMTRAKQSLDLLQPLKYWVPEQARHGDKHVYGAKSRFLTARVVKHLEQTCYPPPAPAAAIRQDKRRAIQDIRKKLLERW